MSIRAETILKMCFNFVFHSKLTSAICIPQQYNVTNNETSFNHFSEFIHTLF